MKSRIALAAGLAGGVLAATSAALIASDVTGLVTFTSGTPALASEVNGNFSAVKTAVDNNHSRVTTLEQVNAGSRLTALETTVTPAGNIVLVPSTASAGNILKGAFPFIHNFGTNNTFIGENAGNFTMTNSENTASGAAALQNNTTGNGNTASGAAALQNNTTGNGNTASGAFALFSNTIGIRNTASGAAALTSNTTGSLNTASGVNALLRNTTGGSNVASGDNALLFNTTGDGNVAIGWRALESISTGSHNIAIGFLGGNGLTGSSNIAIGNQGLAGESLTTRIGSGQTRAFIDGIRGVTTATAAITVLIGTDGQLGTTNSSRRVKDDIADMGEASSALMRLHPVTFHYKTDKSPKGRTLQYGLVAEEVAGVAPGLVARSADGEIETVYYQFLAPMLVNEYQKQQRTIEAQAARITELEKQAMEIAELKRQTARMAVLLGRLEQAGRIAAVGR